MTAYAIALNTSCEGDRLASAVTSTFLPQTSWVKSAYTVDRRAEETLKHEQAHFDLSEVLARRLRAALRDFQSSCNGTDAARVALYAKYQNEDATLQRRYDRETAHGTDSRQQQIWEARIRSWLGDPIAPRRLPFSE
jgi:predicted secreted Zn-dependent protease